MLDRELFTAKLLARVEYDTNGGCWLWSGGLNPGGYGSFFVKKSAGKMTREPAHRLSYRLFRGEIPAGLQIDHLCRVRCCCNPAHMETVTARVNTLRSKATSALNALKTHCPLGHEYSPENTWRRRGARICRTCVQARRLATGVTKGVGRGALKTHCLRGHPFSGDNLHIAGGRRFCRACWSARRAEKRNGK